MLPPLLCLWRGSDTPTPRMQHGHTSSPTSAASLMMLGSPSSVPLLPEASGTAWETSSCDALPDGAGSSAALVAGNSALTDVGAGGALVFCTALAGELQMAEWAG